MTRNRWYGIYSLAHILVLALLLSACAQESAPVVDEVAQVQAVPTLTPLPPPAVEEVAPTEVVVVATEVVVEEETADSPSPSPPTATALPNPTPVPTDPPPLPTEAPAVVNVTTGQTDDGTFFIGDVNAPVRLVDYSDFV